MFRVPTAAPPGLRGASRAGHFSGMSPWGGGFASVQLGRDSEAYPGHAGVAPEHDGGLPEKMKEVLGGCPHSPDNNGPYIYSN